MDGGVAASRRLLRAATQGALVQYRNNLGRLRAASQRSLRYLRGRDVSVSFVGIVSGGRSSEFGLTELRRSKIMVPIAGLVMSCLFHSVRFSDAQFLYPCVVVHMVVRGRQACPRPGL